MAVDKGQLKMGVTVKLKWWTIPFFWLIAAVPMPRSLARRLCGFATRRGFKCKTAS